MRAEPRAVDGGIEPFRVSAVPRDTVKLLTTKRTALPLPTCAGRETGRVLYWNRGSGGSYSVYRVSRVGGGNNYLGGMDGAKDILAFTTRTPSLRFLRMPPGGSPTELQAFTYAEEK